MRLIQENLPRNIFVDDVLANIAAMVHVPSTIGIPAWIDGSGRDAKRFISLQNGILDLDKYLTKKPDALQPHTPNFFTLGCLPFPYDPAARASRWDIFLEEVQPNPENRTLIQECFGYCFTQDTSFEKQFIFRGEGSDGKSVVLQVMRIILGEDNYANIAMEQLDIKRTFVLSRLVGKSANISTEMGEMDKAAEGLMKMLISGEPITIEEKNQPAFRFEPRAKFVWSTNVLPRFTDKTDGMSRRTIIVDFRVQTLDENRQDKRLRSTDWWKESGELPGIFNWALEGLANLTTRGRFIEPKESL
jgi:putative DNA primase/helicase